MGEFSIKNISEQAIQSNHSSIHIHSWLHLQSHPFKQIFNLIPCTSKKNSFSKKFTWHTLILLSLFQPHKQLIENTFINKRVKTPTFIKFKVLRLPWCICSMQMSNVKQAHSHSKWIHTLKNIAPPELVLQCMNSFWMTVYLVDIWHLHTAYALW